MPSRAMFVLATFGLAACSGAEGFDPSKPADPSVTFDIPPPAVNEDWPCPPFGTPTDEAGLGDTDGDLLSDCQELAIHLDPTKADTDGDGFDDYTELGDGGLLEPEDTDGDDVIDALDADDDGDTVPTAVEGPDDDYDGDGIPNHLDDDDDDDGLTGDEEDLDGDLDATNDDADGDGVANWLDPDDDDDGVNTLYEGDGDADGDGLPNFVDWDDDADGIRSGDEDADGDGDPTNDDLDGDGVADFLDPDEDGDDVPNALEDLDGDGLVTDHDSDGDGMVDYRDPDDDNDHVIVESDPSDEKPVATRWYDLDGDGLPNYRDPNDDGDGCTTLEEDADGDGDPTNDNTNVETGDYDPADYLDPAAETCANPLPEPPPSLDLILTLDTPLPLVGSGLLVTIEGGAAPLHFDDVISNRTQTWTLSGLDPDTAALTVYVTVDVDDNGACDTGTDEEAMYSFTVSGLAVTDYSPDLAVDLGALTTDLASVTVAVDSAACGMH